MLPARNANEFPVALKKAREEKQLTNTELAEAIGINPVMIGRYEHTCNKNYFSPPSQETWRKLNDYLFKEMEVETNSLSSINDVTIEDLIKELKRRGAKSVNIEW